MRLSIVPVAASQEALPRKAAPRGVVAALEVTSPPPSGGEFGRLTAIYLRPAFARLRQVEERFELFELFRHDQRHWLIV